MKFLILFLISFNLFAGTEISGSLRLRGATSGTTAIKAAATTTTGTYTLPSAVTTAGALTNDGAGNLSWAASSLAGSATGTLPYNSITGTSTLVCNSENMIAATASISAVPLYLPTPLSAGCIIDITSTGAGFKLYQSLTASQTLYDTTANTPISSTLLGATTSRYGSISLVGTSTASATVKNKNAFTTYIGVAKPSWLMTNWKLDEASGNGLATFNTSYPMTQVGTVGASTGKTYPTARGTYSTSNYFRVTGSNTTSTIWTSANFIVDGWFKTGACTNHCVIIGHGDYSNGWVVELYSSSQFVVYTNGAQIFSTGSYGDNNWHYFTFLRISDTSKSLWIDGNFIGTNTTANGMSDSAAYTHIGYTSVVPFAFPGYIADVSFSPNPGLSVADAQAYHLARYALGVGATIVP